MSVAIMFFAGFLLGSWSQRKGWDYFKDRGGRLLARLQRGERTP